jgi:branched-chain amino acid transport system permease protein
MFTRTPLGRMCGAVRDNPERAEFVGYDATRVRYLAMCLSGFFAGVAGALATLNFELTNSSMMGAAQSANVLVTTYIGGIGFFWGPIVGAAIVTLLQFWLSDFTNAWMLYFGLLFILIVMFVPDGVAGWISRHIALARTGRLGVLAGSYALVAPAFVLTFAGGVLLIELAHHALVESQSEGPAMSVFHVQFSDASPGPWAVALLLFGAGAAVLYFFWPRVTAAWDRAIGPAEKVGEE